MSMPASAKASSVGAKIVIPIPVSSLAAMSSSKSTMSRASSRDPNSPSFSRLEGMPILGLNLGSLGGGEDRLSGISTESITAITPFDTPWK